MEKEERRILLQKALVVFSWCEENIEEYHQPRSAKIFELVKELDEIK